MNRRTGLAALVASSMIGLILPAPARAGDEPASASAEADDVQDVMFLGENRPILIRFRVDSAGKGFRSAWHDAIGALYKYLDRNGDGALTKEEVARGSLPEMVRAATGGAAALPHSDLDTNPRDGKVSLDELAEVLRPALGPFRVEVGRLAAERNDALFNHVDRDKDGAMDRDELGAAVASLHRFDLDDNDLIDRAELEPFSNPMAMAYEDRTPRGRLAPIPPVIELSAGDPSFRPVRLLLKKYDNGAGENASAGDNRLTPGEFAIDPKVFEKADADGDGALDTEELRRLLTRLEPELELTVKLAGGGPTKKAATITAAHPDGRAPTKGVRIETLSDGHLEIALGDIRLEFHADGGENAAEEARAYYAGQFRAADADKNMYLEKSEVKEQPPFSTMFEAMDRDGDGKLYLKEVDAFVDRQVEAARSQMVLSISDQGRSIFSIVDQNRDRNLGIREIRGAVTRASSWDHDGDGRVRSDEIPHHYQMTIGRGRITGIGMSRFRIAAMESQPAKPADGGPRWFRKMDRNRDGDVSRREFLGPPGEFDKLDADHDGLIDLAEAARAASKAKQTAAR
jgi:Ca2+-binding EF-hand superfamily protein